jgi:2'-5' RNA ligase
MLSKTAGMFGITLRTTETAQAFWTLADRASAFEREPSARGLNYAPHLTLARYENMDPRQLVAGLDAFTGARPITLTFDRICVFDAEPAVLWLRPRPAPELVKIHARLHASLGQQASDPHYRPESWQPHCTLAASVAPECRAAALAFAEDAIAPFALTFDVADALSWPPPTPIASRILSESLR